MRVHIQNDAADTLFAVTPAQWEAAAGRAGRADLDVSFGEDARGFAQGLAGADILIAAPGPLRRLLPLPPNRLQIVFCLAAGLDPLAPFAWLPGGVALWNNRGAHGVKAGEYALMAILMLAARVPSFIAAQRVQQWAPLYTPSVRGLRLTVIGTGDLGASAAGRARALGIETTGINRSGAENEAFARVLPSGALDDVLPRSDVLLLACPLTAQTRGLIDARRLALLPAGAGVINIGRGALLDQDALCDRLELGALAGAILDVTDPEPPPEGHRLWTTPGLILTPHVSCDDPAAYNATSLDILFDNLRRVAEGAAAPNRVDVRRGY